MLDLLLLRAQQASSKLYARATVMPNPYELQRIKRSEHFCNLMLEALAWIDAQDGRSTLTLRKDEIVLFGELLAFVLWQLKERQLSQAEYYNLLLEERGSWN